MESTFIGRKPFLQPIVHDGSILPPEAFFIGIPWREAVEMVGEEYLNRLEEQFKQNDNAPG